MKTKFIEASNGVNWGKFVLGRFDAAEWKTRSAGEPTMTRALIVSQGWTEEHIWVLDLATGEGAYFRPWGLASYDLEKHRIWVCPLFEPFLTWLYKQDLTDLDKLPPKVELSLKEAPFAMQGYRRPGPQADALERITEELAAGDDE